ncbi:hypothetical protein GCM10011504_16870 [Siccirubricoccus deserti]|uniref:Transposase n=1 Tax=Siccirubricoccus deserti TaxID=2013562 RepID=A0A9X0UCZ7_9PROT|nr:transposase [Siccirubricoccus deserti]GGC39063.1 hypothetical protein GCM10011504_16870 [Siccirubricoccus deserti]
MSTRSWRLSCVPAVSSSWDNPGHHKGAGIRPAIEATGASLLYLPPQSPDFNPIENAFTKLKARREAT